jgi:hypothetical protein
MKDYERDVAAPNRKVYGPDVEAARNVLKKYRKGQWHINGEIVREALDAAYASLKLTDAMAQAYNQAVSDTICRHPSSDENPCYCFERAGFAAAFKVAGRVVWTNQP